MNLENFAWYDTDGDGIGNTGLWDADGDGRYDTAAHDVDGDHYVESYAHDTNGDGVWDHFSQDTDLDGVLDSEGWDDNGDGIMDRGLGPGTGGQVVEMGQPEPQFRHELNPYMTITRPSNPDYTMGLVEMAGQSNDPWVWGQVMDILDSQTRSTGQWTLPDGWYYDRNWW